MPEPTQDAFLDDDETMKLEASGAPKEDLRDEGGVGDNLRKEWQGTGGAPVLVLSLTLHLDGSDWELPWGTTCWRTTACRSCAWC